MLDFNLEELRKIKVLALISVFSDDDLMEHLVLKGGNAIELIYEIGSRYSIDLDFSLGTDFHDIAPEELEGKFKRTLEKTFAEAGYVVFDVKLKERPPEVSPDLADFWGGYLLEFKIIQREKVKEAGTNIELKRKLSEPIAPGQNKTFRIEISKFEYCEDKQSATVDGYTIYVYTPAMIVAEKLRAICQQMPEYGQIVRSKSQSSRGRDFYDIFLVVTTLQVDMMSDANIILLRKIFAAKRVPLSLLARIEDYREYHESNFRVVEDTTRTEERLNPFNYYFDFVIDLVVKLKSRGVI